MSIAAFTLQNTHKIYKTCIHALCCMLHKCIFSSERNEDCGCPFVTVVTSDLLRCSCIEYPYVSFLGEILLNHSYVDLGQVGNAMDGSNSLQCHTDLFSCCNYNQGGNRGDWMSPNGTTQLPFTGAIHEQRKAQKVDLRRIGNAGVTSGMYRCVIETNDVNRKTNSGDYFKEIVYIG